MNLNQITIPQALVGVLYENGAYARTLAPGRYRLKNRLFDKVERTVTLVDVRERSITIKGQEILTADKVAIRVSLLVYFRVVDPVAALHNVASYEERIYEDVQLAARRFLANRTLDAILSDRNEISDAVRDDVKTTAAAYGVEIVRADVKDLVFPGNLREIMNQVLETERRAEAELIRARKDADAAKIKAESLNAVEHLKHQAELEHARLKHEAELEHAHRVHQAGIEQARLNAEAGFERARIEAKDERARAELKLALALEQAKALRDNPELYKLRELEALIAMAQAGGRFAVGLRTPAASTLLSDADRADANKTRS
jgi:regulator of protease activity HflC (stomatin/prohibitin superfamily)